MYRAIMRRKLGLLGKAAAAAAGDAAAASSTQAAAPAPAAAAGAPASARPIWPIAAAAADDVAAAAAAVAAAPLQPGSGQLDEVDDKLFADLLTIMEETGRRVAPGLGQGGGFCQSNSTRSTEICLLTCSKRGEKL
jgi:uncharacterized protein YbjT (DUF2867 family)